MQKFLLATAVLAAATTPLHAADDEPVLDVYSARGEATVEAVYNDFIERSGIRINRLENDNATTFERLKAESDDPNADVVLLDGLAWLHAANIQNLLKPVQSDALDAVVPERLRAAPTQDGGTAWFGFAQRARVIVYNPQQVKSDEVRTYAQLADSQNKGKLCMTPATDGANLGLLSAMIEHEGAEKTESWLKSVTGNLAGAPAGTDADQVRAVADGTCQIALADHFALAQFMRSDVAEEREMAKSVAVMFPNQGSWGTHVDVAGAAVAHRAKHPDEALKFLEYLGSEQGQNLFANGSDEWPVVEKLRFDNDTLQTLLDGQENFKGDETPLHQIANHLGAARDLAERVTRP